MDELSLGDRELDVPVRGDRLVAILEAPQEIGDAVVVALGVGDLRRPVDDVGQRWWIAEHSCLSHTNAVPAAVEPQNEGASGRGEPAGARGRGGIMDRSLHEVTSDSCA